MEKQRIRELNKQLDEFDKEMRPVIKSNELEKEKRAILKLINSLKGHERDLMEKGKNILSTKYVSIVEFDDEIVMRFKKGGWDKHKKIKTELPEKLKNPSVKSGINLKDVIRNSQAP